MKTSVNNVNFMKLFLKIGEKTIEKIVTTYSESLTVNTVSVTLQKRDQRRNTLRNEYGTQMGKKSIKIMK